MRRILVAMLSICTTASCAPPVQRQTVAPPASPVPMEAKAAAESDASQIVGQTIYVPVYSHIYFRDKSRTINLTATLSIRNTDAQAAIRVAAVRYYDTHGKLVRSYVSAPFLLAPMASTDYVVAEDDTSGGAGANFIVEWTASQKVTEPVVEAVMISTASGQGISFLSTGRVIASRAPEASGK